MAIRHGLVSVGTTATLLAAVEVGRSGQTILVQNPSGGANVFIGGAGVTTASYGYLVTGGSAFAIELENGEGIFAVVATGTQSVAVLRQGA
jgi:hypothetical protein